jgi:hypothetical protein
MTMSAQGQARDGYSNPLGKEGPVGVVARLARCAAALLAAITIAAAANDAVGQKLDVCGPANIAAIYTRTAPPVTGVPKGTGWLYDFSIGTFVATNRIPNMFTPGVTPADKVIASYMEKAAIFYSVEGMKPPILRCYQDPSNNAWTYSLHYESMSDAHGSYLTLSELVATNRARLKIDPPLQTAFGMLSGSGTIRGDVLSTPSHELFHAVQQSYRFMKGNAKEWVWEGMAEAMGNLYANEYYRNMGIPESRINKNGTRNTRYFNHPLHIPKGETKNQAYGTSLFWEFLINNPVFNFQGSNITLAKNQSPGTLSLELIEQFWTCPLGFSGHTPRLPIGAKEPLSGFCGWMMSL